ncbi:hypothetical protein CDU01_20305, partial [Cronobacter sakazakii]
MVTDLRSEEIHRVLEVRVQLRLHWKDRFGYCAPLKPVTLVQKFPNLLNLQKNRLPSRFFCFRNKIPLTHPQNNHSKW